MSNSSITKQYDLEERTLSFAKQIRFLVKQLPKTIGNLQDCKQLIRSSGSVGANYIEANHALSKKDFTHRIKISRKEAKESSFWLQLIDTSDDQQLEDKRLELFGESVELVKIFSAIMTKSTN